MVEGGLLYPLRSVATQNKITLTIRWDLPSVNWFPSGLSSLGASFRGVLIVLDERCRWHSWRVELHFLKNGGYFYSASALPSYKRTTFGYCGGITRGASACTHLFSPCQAWAEAEFVTLICGRMTIRHHLTTSNWLQE